MAAQPKHIVVTGSEGFVGSYLVRHLRSTLAPPYSIVAATRRPEPCGDVALDVTDPAAVDALVSHYKPHAVVHLAAIAAPTENVTAGRPAWETNLFSTINLADSLAKHSPGSIFIFSSSSEVYGGTFNQPEGRPATEQSLLAPLNVYAATKAAADLYLGHMGGKGLRVIRFRAFNHTGPGQSEKFVVPAFAGQIARLTKETGRRIVRVGNLDGQRDFLDVRDIVRAYAAPLLQDNWPSGAIINLASGTPRRIGDILTDIIDLSGIEVEIQQDIARLRSSEVPVAFGDATRARDLFAWEPRIAWEQTLQDVFEYQFRHAHAG